MQCQQFSLDTSCPSLRDSDSMLTSSMATFELDVDADSEVGDPAAPIPELEQETEAPQARDPLYLPLNKTNTAKEQDPEPMQSPLSPDRCVAFKFTSCVRFYLNWWQHNCSANMLVIILFVCLFGFV